MLNKMKIHEKNNMEDIDSPLTETMGQINSKWVIIQSHECPACTEI